MVVCVYLPRFELIVAAGEGSRIVQQALAGKPLAVAPQVGSEQRVGEVSGAAEACGVLAGMALGEALARCPELALVAADPVRVAESWERAVRGLESIGAAVEAARPGLAYFETDGLRGLHGSHEGAILAARQALERPARVGGGPTRFCALAGALAVRSRRPFLLDGPAAPGPPAPEVRRWLAGQPVGLLGYREETEALLEPLGRLGVRTLGELAKLGRPALSDRFGEAGVLAHRLACGEDSPLRVRHPEERLQETLSVGDASSGSALKRVLGVLVNRLLARPERRGRTLRCVTLSAYLLAGGGWSERVVFRQALSDPERIWLALSLRLLLLPAPAAALRLTAERFGPPANEQRALFDRDPARPADPARSARSAERAARLREAIAQVRAVGGRDAVLRAVCVDPDSRVPERRVVLAPIPEQ
jgi:protein ImuB